MASLSLLSILLLAAIVQLLVAVPALAVHEPGKEEKPCAKKCHTIDCSGMGIRYGRFCGVGHGGCPGVKPCDDVDACCKEHDECVEKHSVMANTCHASFIQCLDQHKGKKGFAEKKHGKCPYDEIIPTMQSGIRMAMMFSSAFGGGEEDL